MRNIKQLSSNEYIENSFEKLTNKKKNFPPINETISEISYQQEKSESNDAGWLIEMFQKNEKKFQEEINKLKDENEKLEKLREENGKLKNEISEKEEITNDI